VKSGSRRPEIYLDFKILKGPFWTWSIPRRQQ
jgi:hypothetical protein